MRPPFQRQRQSVEITSSPQPHARHWVSLGELCKSANTRKDLNALSLLRDGPFGKPTDKEGRWQKDGDPLVMNSSL